MPCSALFSQSAASPACKGSPPGLARGCITGHFLFRGTCACCSCFGHGCLFCLTADPTEHHDLAASHPAALQFMQATLHKMQHGFFDPTRDGGNKSVPVQAAIDYGGFWGPFLE